ncbi:hypothetical protein [Chitinophaga sp. Cy-1792]|uniref:hypothetical protein n=1 Tax=Chitinophaga sp. Cy-1792 TaxID=2608339 RepID=UPI0014248110|nr:hypothetical protein [Chitinophaga sp. Cy-1792]NIG53380.1 hypothetical protein [Chitinophaga sp. Cy-1792]
MRQVTPEMIAAGKAALNKHFENAKYIMRDDPYERKVQHSESIRELSEYLSDEKNADDFAFSAWCASQRRDWQLQRDAKRAAYKMQIKNQQK